jgi:hypothetical protein
MRAVVIGRISHRFGSVCVVSVSARTNQVGIVRSRSVHPQYRSTYGRCSRLGKRTTAIAAAAASRLHITITRMVRIVAFGFSNLKK